MSAAQDRLSTPLNIQPISSQTIQTPHMHGLCNSFLEEYESRSGEQSTKTQLEVLCEALREEVVGDYEQRGVAFRRT
ncbi:hypothetical protein RSOLAG1IB_07795 [Rhizoctonia solani AG-1 IB]|uniref:Uncharacterized protein n=1 Tax=Thanatephorus cucumeris (strain AG1-IB / isolate 7/3/14) TaxID=1108050 RepID=A0A0B7FHH4_THACB|nr:hypothetical protein RSOLAG1IB_07795 [Rhizoctonia solani AG-1 IB]